MINLLLSSPYMFLLVAASLLIVITIHEFAHAWMANKLGDPTPRMQGRLTLNPLAHLDPLGTLGILLVGFGWGKPVQFDPFNLSNPKRDAAAISFAGPFSNILFATVLAFVYRFAPNPYPFFPLHTFLELLIVINVRLAIFNLVPIHPLDGGKILVGLLPHYEAVKVDRFLQQYGMIILLLLVFPFTGISPILAIINPIVNIFLSVYLPTNPII